jgi:integrase
MARTKLNERIIERMAAPDPSGRQQIYWDESVRGFGVLVSGITKSKTYVAQRDVDGKTRRVTIAPVAEITLSKAREQATEILLGMKRGAAPAAKSNMTLAQVYEDYLVARKDLRPATIRKYGYDLRHLASWMNEPLRTITPVMVEARHRAIVQEVGARYKGEFTANQSLKTFRTLWNFAADRIFDLGRNPVKVLERQFFEEAPRTRMVRAEDMAKFYAAVDALPNKVQRDYLLLLMFTGMRRKETASLRWEDIDFTTRVIRVPAANTKSGRRLNLPMTDFVFDLLVARRAIGKMEFVFPSNSRCGHITEPEKVFDRIAEECGIRISAHDFRRGYLTIATICDVHPMVLKALVNHSVGNDVTSGYIQIGIEQLREPAQRVTNKLKELCGIAPVSGKNVAKLRAE